MLAALTSGEVIADPVTVVVAHPDDETLGLGARLSRFARLTLVHVTDGAPLSLEDARRTGFADRAAYAQARAAELDRALEILGVAARREALGVRDQDAVRRLPWLAAQLGRRLAHCAVVITHPYEGGHPDHDAASFAVQAACARLGAAAPLRLEFAGYHLRDGRRVCGRFWPTPGRIEAALEIAAPDLARKAAAVACFRSQAEVLAGFDPAREAYRQAPDYDFTAASPPGRALYDGFGWPLASGEWRAAAAAALAMSEAAE